VECAVLFLEWDLILDSLELMVNLAGMPHVDDTGAGMDIIL
jgi:hypothetical protein